MPIDDVAAWLLLVLATGAAITLLSRGIAWLCDRATNWG